MRWIDGGFVRPFLVVYVILAFFAPPIAWGVKKIFIVDGWIALAALAGLLLSLRNPPVMRSPRITGDRASWALWIGILALALVYWHGKYRPSLKEDLDYALAYARDNDGFRPFDAVQDGILWLRFTSWLGAAVALVLRAKQTFKNREEALGFLGRLWGGACVAESLLALLAYHSPLRQPLGTLYGYDPDYLAWANRLYGSFSSPIELSAVLAMGVLWWLAQVRTLGPGARRTRAALALGVCSVGLIHTNSYTAVLGCFMGAAFLFRGWILPRWKILTIVLTITTAFFVYASTQAHQWAAEYPWFFKLRFHDKIPNLLFRMKPWKIFLDSIFSRWDHALLGMGFARSHSDNGYLQILRTGGLTLFAPLMALLVMHCRNIMVEAEKGPALLWSSAITICVLTSAMATDVLIFRAAGTLFFWVLALNLAFHRTAKYPIK